MASRGRSTWWLHLIVTVAAVSTRWQVANSDPQTNQLGIGCSSVTATSAFFSKLNAAFSDLRSQLSQDKRFGTAQRVTFQEPVYALVQCRKYLSVTDCLACYDKAVSDIRSSCNQAMGARVTYDGCFLRYEGYNFYKKTNENALRCSDRKANAAVNEQGQDLLKDLQLAAPKAKGYWAANKRATSKGGKSSMVYAVAQCVETVSQEGCQGCLNAAFETLVDCLYAAEGRLTDAACFMRFSDTPFFADKDITS